VLRTIIGDDDGPAFARQLRDVVVVDDADQRHAVHAALGDLARRQAAVVLDREDAHVDIEHLRAQHHALENLHQIRRREEQMPRAVDDQPDLRQLARFRREVPRKKRPLTRPAIKDAFVDELIHRPLHSHQRHLEAPGQFTIRRHRVALPAPAADKQIADLIADLEVEAGVAMVVELGHGSLKKLYHLLYTAIE
jgi:hypothetical protein